MMAKLTTPADLDRAVLKALSARGDTMTYVLRNCLVMDGYYGHRPRKIETSKVLRACRRLAKLRHAEEVQVNARDKCWRITAAGRAALTEHKDTKS